MSDKKPMPKEVTNDILLADAMLRITAMEKLLIEKGVFTQEELTAATDEIAKRVAKVVLEKASASKTIDELIDNLKDTVVKKPDQNN